MHFAHRRPGRTVRRALRPLAAAALVAALLALGGAVAAAGAPAPVTAIHIDAPPTEWVHPGTAVYAARATAVTVTDAGPDRLALTVTAADLAIGVASLDGSPLAAGTTYHDEGHNAAVTTGHFTMAVGSRACWPYAVDFTVVEWDTDGAGELRRAAVDVAARCANTADVLHAAIRLASTVPVEAVDLAAATVAIDAVRTGSPALERPLTVTNPGTAPVAIGPVAVTGTGADMVAADASACPAVLGPGAACTIVLTVEPAHRGWIDARVTLADGTARGSRWTAVTGRVQDPTSVAVTLHYQEGLWQTHVAVTPNPGGGYVRLTVDGDLATEGAWLGQAGARDLAFFPDLGPFTVVASFLGGDLFEPSASAPVDDTHHAYTITRVAVDHAPSSPAGSPILVTSTTTSYGAFLAPGTVEIRDDDGSLLLAAPVQEGSWTASVATTPLTTGTHTYTATYTSDVPHVDPSTGSATQTIVPPDAPVPLGIRPAIVTTTPDVTLGLLPPPAGGGRVRLSNDGFTWVERDWVAELPWSLVDPAAGGRDEDGVKHVFAWYREDGDWVFQQGVEVRLVREAPETGGPSFDVEDRLWRGAVTLDDQLPDVAELRISLDGTTWAPWQDRRIAVDLHAMPGAAAWYAGDHTVWFQVRDAAGHESSVRNVTATVHGHDMAAPAGGEGVIDVGFTFPRPAITGQPFTIRPVYPAGYTLPADAWCQWHLHWGDDASIMGPPNPTWGEILFERPKSSGACTEWTFTLPYNASRQFTWMFQAYHKPAGLGPDEMGAGIYVSSNTEGQIFRALLGSTDPHIRTSNVPIAYLLPETTVSQAGDPVTYRLYTTGGAAIPQTGMFWTYPINCYLNPHWSQTGGTTYTYTPRCNGPWVTGWTGVMNKGYMRSQYDPLVDGRDPKVVAPRVAPRAGGFGTSVPVTVSWSATDKGSGVYRYQLQVSRNGGAWRDVALASRLTTSMTRSLAPDGSYRFRVRARDRVGNWSDWAPGPTLRARVLQEGSSAAHWSAGWSRVVGAALSGTAARASTTAGSTVRLTTTARGISWVARRGPGRGLAEVYVDGARVGTVDLGAPALTGRQAVFTRSWTSAATHTVVIRNLATDGRPLVEVDAFLVVR